MELLGRQSSHYTRVVRMLAHELGLELPVRPLHDLMSLDPASYGGNPALKLPILRLGDEPLFGTLNICRALAAHAGRSQDVYWPGQADRPLLMNAHELLAHAMAAEVEVVLHEAVMRRPPDAASTKRRDSLLACLAWLDAHLDAVLQQVRQRPISWFELCLFALLAHIPFRNPLDIGGLRRLLAFEGEFAQRPSAQATPYRFDS